MYSSYSATWTVVIALLATAVLPRPARSQTAADSSAVLKAMLDHLFAPEHASHYYGERPWKPFHPQGEPRGFCLASGDGRAGELLPVDSPAIVAAARGRVTEAFGLRYVDDCVLRRSEDGVPFGFLDGEGALAVRVEVEVILRSSSEAYVHFAVNPGAWPGLHGWRCLLARGEDGTWQVIGPQCSFYES